MAFLNRDNLTHYIKQRIGFYIFILIAVTIVIWGSVSIQRLRSSASRSVVEYTPREANIDLDNSGEY
jgi:uncharacterized membrane protein